MRMSKSAVTGISILFISLAALASTARSSTGQGPSEADAIAAAKSAAQDRYGDKIESWGNESCSKIKKPKSQYDVPGQESNEPWYRCVVDFNTKD